MAQITGIFAASHTPVMLQFPEAIPAADREEIYAAFRETGKAIAASKPQAIVVFSDDHLHNFFLNNLPAICIGAADQYPAPVEHWLKAEKRVLQGDAGLGAYLLSSALENGFDPSFSMELTLDHGVLTPLELAGVARDVPVVPVLFNCVQPPMPTMRRCYQFGDWLGRALRAYGALERVAILATGGISHDLATPRMGMVNEAFDREFLRLLEAADGAGAVTFAAERVHEAGNGAEEIRMWLAAMGCAEGRPFRTHYYRAVRDWYTGIALGSWASA
ncbi:MAG TPA: 2,3-dihydroxyphenylpropionate 1,2-dioxygenase [Burkholderiales bacterium]|nr:2,3-dihydroxyphenylpropionate 1,2-dioxygenase [Burkholderiales bacterium]